MAPAASSIFWPILFMTPVLYTARLTLRPLKLQDAAALFAYRRDADVMRYWDWPPQKTIRDVQRIVRRHAKDIANGRVNWWAVALTEDGPSIGECDLSEIDQHHKHAEVGFLFHPDLWGKGYAHEAMVAVIAHAFDTLLLERLWARSHSGNTKSHRLLARLGFEHEGTLRAHILRDGERRDCEIHGLLRDNHFEGRLG
jgi:ribosomal-protein-alanine N-acetyltransferase